MQEMVFGRADLRQLADAATMVWQGDGFFSAVRGDGVAVRGVGSDAEAVAELLRRAEVLCANGPVYQAALSAHGRRIIVADQGETVDDLVRDMIEVLTSMWARVYGRRGARNRAMRAVTATKQAEPVGLVADG